MGYVNKFIIFKSLLTMPSNVLPLHLKQTFPHIIRVFTESEGDGIKSRLPFTIFSTLSYQILKSQECLFRNIFIPLCPTKTISWHCILMVRSHVLWLIMRSMHFKLKVKKVKKCDIFETVHILNVLKLVTDIVLNVIFGLTNEKHCLYISINLIDQ